MFYINFYYKTKVISKIYSFFKVLAILSFSQFVNTISFVYFNETQRLLIDFDFDFVIFVYYELGFKYKTKHSVP